MIGGYKITGRSSKLTRNYYLPGYSVPFKKYKVRFYTIFSGTWNINTEKIIVKINGVEKRASYPKAGDEAYSNRNECGR